MYTLYTYKLTSSLQSLTYIHVHVPSHIIKSSLLHSPYTHTPYTHIHIPPYTLTVPYAHLHAHFLHMHIKSCSLLTHAHFPNAQSLMHTHIHRHTHLETFPLSSVDTYGEVVLHPGNLGGGDWRVKAVSSFIQVRTELQRELLPMSPCLGRNPSGTETKVTVVCA